MKTIKNKERIILFAIFGLIAITLIAGTYAYLKITINTSGTHTLVAGTFNVDYQDGEYINIQEAVPLSDEKGMTTTEYTFSVSNTGNIDARYKLYLEEDTSIADKDKLSHSQVKYSLKQGDGNWSEPALLSTLKSGLVLVEDQKLNAKSGDTVDSINYALKIWVDKNVGNEGQAKTFKAKVVVDAIQGNATIDNYTSSIGPSIVLNGKTVENIESGSTYNDPGVKSVSDDKDALNIEQVTKTYQFYNGKEIVDVDGIDTNKIGVYYITYKISDRDGNEGIAVRTVIVYKKDTTPPTIKLNGEKYYEIMVGDSFEDLGATATDPEEGDISFRIVTVGKVNTKKAGTYIIRYLVEDQEGNTASETRTVVVKDSIPVTVKFEQGDGVTSIGARELTCEISGQDDSCEIELPSITSAPGYDDGLWYENATGTGQGKAANTKVSVSEDTTFYAIAKDTTKPVCTFVSASPSTVEKDGTVTVIVDCTDTSGTLNDNLNKENIDVTIGGKTETSVSRGLSQTPITNGIRYTLSLTNFSTGGILAITIPQGSVMDASGNANDDATFTISDVVIQNLLKVTIIRSTGVSQIGTSTDAQVTLNCNVTGNNNSCSVTLPTLTTSSPYTGAIYASDTNGAEPQYNVGEATFSKDTTLYALGYREYTLTLNKNAASVTAIDGDSTSSSITKTCRAYGNGHCKITLPSITVADGYSTGYWGTNSTYNTQKWAQGAEYEMTENHTLTAYGTISRSLKFSYTSDSGVSSIGSTIETCTAYGTAACNVTVPSITVNSATPAYTGVWFPNQNATGTTTYNPGASISVSATMSNNGTTYYAFGKRNLTLTITKDVGVDSIDGNTEATYTDTCTQYGTKACNITLPTAVQSAGYDSVVYSKGTEETYTRYNPGNSYSMTENDTLNAYGTVERFLNLSIASNAEHVSAIGATKMSCSAIGSASCTAKFPSITMTSSSYTGKWVSATTVTSGGYDPNSTIILTSSNSNTSASGNITYYATSTYNISLTVNVRTGISSIAGNTSAYTSSCTKYGDNTCTVYFPSASQITVDSGYSGYLLTSSSTAASSGTIYTAGQALAISANTTAYAFGGQVFTLTINKGNGIYSIAGSTASSVSYTCTRYSTQPCSVSLPALVVTDTSTYNGGGVFSTASSQASVTASNIVSASSYTLSSNENLYTYGKKDITVSYTYYSTGISSIGRTSDTCTAYGTANCSFNLPSITVSDSSTYPYAYWYNQTSTTATSDGYSANTTISVSASTTYIALAARMHTLYIYRTSSVTAIGGSTANPYTLSCKRYGSQSSCSVTYPSLTITSGYDSGSEYYATSATTTSVSAYPGNSQSLTGDVTRYAMATRTFTVTFKNGHTAGVSTIDGSSVSSTTRSCTIQGNTTSCNITSPTIGVVSGYQAGRWFEGDRTYATYSLISSSIVSGGTITMSSSNTNTVYSALAGTTTTATLYSTTSASPASSSVSCVRYGASSASCQLTLPTVIPASGYSGGFYASSTTNANAGTQSNVSGATVTVTANITRYATAYQILYVSYYMYSSYTTYGVGSITGMDSSTSSSSTTITSAGYVYSNCYIYGNSTSCSTTAASATRYSTTWTGVLFTTSASSPSETGAITPGTTMTIGTSASGSIIATGSRYYAVGYKLASVTFYSNWTYGAYYTSASNTTQSQTGSCTAFKTATTCAVQTPSLSLRTYYNGYGWGTVWNIANTYASGSIINISTSGSSAYYATGYQTYTANYSSSTGVSAVSPTSSTCQSYGNNMSCNVTTPTSITYSQGYSNAFFTASSSGTTGVAPGGTLTLNGSSVSVKTFTIYVKATTTATLVNTLIGKATSSGITWSVRQSYANQGNYTYVQQPVKQMTTLATTTYGCYNCDEYRYTGNMPENYIWFHDELWRIIGVTAELQANTSTWTHYTKIIKYSNYTTMGFSTYNWFSDSSRSGTATNYVNSILSGSWGSYLINFRTFYGYNAVSTGSISQWWQWERANGFDYPVTLLYVSDYQYASAEDFNGNCVSDCNKCSASYGSTNWLCNGTNYWTVDGNNYSNTRFLVGSGCAVTQQYTNNYGFRPVVVLNSNVKVTGGVGGGGTSVPNWSADQYQISL